MNVRKKILSEGLSGRGALYLLDALTVKHVALAAFMALAVLVSGARSANAEAPLKAIDCTNGQTPQMTVEIYNNSKRHNIYPVLFAGAASNTDTWMQACFQLTDAELAANPYPGPPNIGCTSIAAPRGRTAFRRAVR